MKISLLYRQDHHLSCRLQYPKNTVVEREGACEFELFDFRSELPNRKLAVFFPETDYISVPNSVSHKNRFESIESHSGICRRDSMISTFHVRPGTSGRGLCDINRV